MLITIDPYYPIEFFNQTKEALKGDDIEAIKSATEKLTEASHKIAEILYQYNL